MDPTPSLWEGILQRASALRRRYANVADAPQDTWSLVGRVAAEKFAGRLDPAARDREHLVALWTRAMRCVLNDLHRRQRGREAAVPGERVPMDEALGDEARLGGARGPFEPDETLAILAEALRELAERDERLGEEKALLVALKYSEGLTWEEIASTLGSSVRRARDEWDVTRAWLRRELRRRGVELD